MDTILFSSYVFLSPRFNLYLSMLIISIYSQTAQSIMSRRKSAVFLATCWSKYYFCMYYVEKHNRQQVQSMCRASYTNVDISCPISPHVNKNPINCTKIVISFYHQVRRINVTSLGYTKINHFATDFHKWLLIICSTIH